MHLTNNAIQKYSENYGKFEAGNQWSYKQFEEYLINNLDQFQSFFKKIINKIQEIISLSLKSTKKKLNLYSLKVLCHKEIQKH